MRFTWLIPVLATVLLTESCNNRSSGDRVTVPSGNLITRAERFSLERIDDKLTILRLHNPWQGAGNVTMVYYLLDREAQYPGGYRYVACYTRTGAKDGVHVGNTHRNGFRPWR
jgi:hypothetical protein